MPELRSHHAVQLGKEESKPFEEYAHLAAADREDRVEFFETYEVRAMCHAKSSFAHFTTNYEIFIAGGSNEHNFSLNQVESYDIKQDFWLKQPDLNIARRSPSLCLFRTRFLYVFGGTQMKKKVDMKVLEEELKPPKDDKIDEKEESENSLKLDSGDGEEEVEGYDDELSAEAASEDSFVDLEEEEANYELDFGEHYVTEIERLDMQGKSGKKKWEVLKLRSEIRIEGQQFGSLQCS